MADNQIPVGDVIVINPQTEIQFDQASTTQQPTTSNIEIINTSREMNVVYKVKTTAPKNYVVRPNQGIIQKGQQNAVEITYIPSDNNRVQDNKFLIQVAYSNLEQTATYALPNFWEKVDKKQVQSYKLRVSTNKTSQLDNQESMASVAPSIMQSDVFKSQVNPPMVTPQSQLPQKSVQFSQNVIQQSNVEPQAAQPSPQTNKENPFKSQDLYESAPAESINASMAESDNQRPSINSTNNTARQENLKRIQQKINEVQKKLQQTESEHKDLKNQTQRILQQQKTNDGKVGNINWKDTEANKDAKYQLIHLIILAIIALFIGKYLGATSAIDQVAVAASIASTGATTSAQDGSL